MASEMRRMVDLLRTAGSLVTEPCVRVEGITLSTDWLVFYFSIWADGRVYTLEDQFGLSD